MKKEIGWGLGEVEGRETVVWKHWMRENKIVLKTQELKEGHGVQIQVTPLFTRSILSYPYQIREKGYQRSFCSNMLLLAFCFLLVLQRPYPSSDF